VHGVRGAFVVTVLASLVGLAGALTVVGASQTPTTASPQDASLATGPGRPNVVVIMTDDMRADELRYMPNVQRLLVDRGVRFTNAVSPHPLCCPARAELMSGQYGQNNGVRHNDGPYGGYKRLDRVDQNIGRWLRDSGYRTSYHGKFLNGYERSHPLREPAGWTFWDAQVGGIYSYWRARFFNGDRYGHEYVTDVMTERTGETFRRFAKQGAPFLTVVNHVAPHVTLDRPHRPIPQPKYADLYKRAVPPSLRSPAYNDRNVADLPRDLRFDRVRTSRVVRLFRDRIRSLRSVDDAVAATVRQLAKLGELDNTYIVFTSDNGNGLGEHRYTGKNIVSEEMLDVPLVIRGPGFAPGTTDATPVSLVDLPATIVDWADATPGHRLDGVSIERLRDDSLPPVRDTMLVQTGDGARDATPGWDYRGVLTDRYLYAHQAGRPRVGILFDRLRDPHALRNVFADPRYTEIRRELAARTDALQRCAGAACNRVFGALPEPG
jgi:arylsulfatase A-like enzyme